MERSSGYIHALNQSIFDLVRSAWRAGRSIIGRSPSMGFFLLGAMRHQRKAARLRLKWEQEGTHVPPFMIVSVTNRCNLHCKGCYARAQHRETENEMTAGKLREVLSEAQDLGISIALLAGGEPFARPELLGITADFRHLLFPVFTNGLLIDEVMVHELKKQRHVIPVVSMEGHAADTDTRRGAGVSERLMKTIDSLKRAAVFFGTSLTVTSENFATVTSKGFIEQIMATGCRLFFFVEYVPVREGTENLVLTDAQRAQLAGITESLRTEFPGLFIAFPGDEEAMGGCLAAGRGFIHISPSGQVEPCPFAPYSDASLKEMSLKDALKSDFLKMIRESDALREEHSVAGGCVLWEEREWVGSLLERQ